MDLIEKLERLTDSENRADISRRAGLPVNTLSNILNSKSRPRIDTAFALARVLQVDLDWLCDPEEEWPPKCKLVDSITCKQFNDDFTNQYGREISFAVAIRLLCQVCKQEDLILTLNADTQTRLREIVAKVIFDTVHKAAELDMTERYQELAVRTHSAWRFLKNRILAEDVINSRMPHGRLVDILIKENEVLEKMNDLLRIQLEDEGIEPDV